MNGYSSTPLVKKLGIKEGSAICILNAPSGYQTTLTPLPQDVNIHHLFKDSFDFIQFFTSSKKNLLDTFGELKKSLKKDGSLWISWPKQSSHVETDLNENIIRNIGLENGLVDVKVIAIDEIYSGLKFVYRLKDR